LSQPDNLTRGAETWAAHAAKVAVEQRTRELMRERWPRGGPIFRVEMVPLEDTPPYVRSAQGVLVHRTRWVELVTWIDTSRPRDAYLWAKLWCGMHAKVVAVADPSTVCHRCDDQAVIAGGLEWSGLLPERGCEASGGQRWRRGRVQR
jgi:hypothetical protein